jgi:cellulose synthase/poly-beta-1,6-N-acetylglucosamine synthase-like glycosyltransferase
MSHGRHRQTHKMKHFSTLAGSLQKIPATKNYTVQYKKLLEYDGILYRNWTRIIAIGALLITISFCAMLFHPSHWIALQQTQSSTVFANWIMLVCLGFLQIFIILGTLSATRSTLIAKNPIPVRPPHKLRVAFATTRAPGEPIHMVRKTLSAMKRVHYARGTVDVWLLDETNDSQLKSICDELNVRYFSRHGIKKWNTTKPNSLLLRTYARFMIRLVPSKKSKYLPYTTVSDPFLAGKSKHGNFNSWREYLRTNGISYDILAGVDTDQVPEQNYLERLLGYFRDSDIAYVVGPQVYSNYQPGLSGLVARWAESQASFFQSTIQRAGNASNTPMFVGTNYAVRMNVLDQIGGFQPCITEDMATGLAIHSSRNPLSGNRWKSVYTPDVLALGEGPDYWGPYFTQQWRWAAGTFDTWRKSVWRVFFKLSLKSMLHYILMLTYYPFTALTWLLAVTSGVVYLVFGATAIIAPWSMFVSLYLMTVIMQMSLYFWNRRFNVSPHEKAGSFGMPGMILSTLTAPIYLSAFIGILRGKKSNFVVTTKSSNENTDWFPAFRTHLQWGGLLSLSLIYGLMQGHSHPAMLVWISILLVICYTPFILGMSLAIPSRIRQHRSNKTTKNRSLPIRGVNNA